MAEPIVILHVCDEPQSLGIRFVLSIAGYCVLVATNRDSALDQLRRHPIALVLADHALVTSDARLAPEIKRVKPEVRMAVVVPSLSGNDPGSSMADVLVGKEAEPSELLAAVAKALGSGTQVALEA
jgi:DNA-binding NarL/FixJ family response regulator